MLTVSKLTFDELWRRYPGDMWRVSPGAGVGSGISTVSRVGTIPIRAANDPSIFIDPLVESPY